MTAPWVLSVESLSLIFWHYATVFLRVSAVVAMLPAFGERTVPIRVKLAVAIAFTVATGAALPVFNVQSAGWAWTAAVVSEPLVGLALGILIRLFVLCLQIAGTIAAQSVSLSQFLGGAAEPVTAMGHILVVAALALAVTMGLHVRAIEFLVHSYDLFPPGRWPDAVVLADWSTGQISRIFALAFLLAAPFVIISVLYNLTLGVINRAMPQLMVAFVGAPAITLGGIVLLGLTAPFLLAVWLEALHGFLDGLPEAVP